MITIGIEGASKLVAQLEKMEKAVERDRVMPIAKKSAQMLKASVQSRAPKGPTGNMKKSVKMKTMKGGVPIMLVAIDQKIAPHWKFHEWGTDTRRPKGRAMVVSSYKGRSGYTSTDFAMYAAPMPVTAPFRKGISAKAKEALKQLHDGLNKNISKAAGLP